MQYRLYRTSICPLGKNAFQQPSVIDATLQKSVKLILGPFPTPPLPNYGVQHLQLLHYLDDFFTAGPADCDVCEQSLNAMLTLCNVLNVPVKPSKVEGPTTSLTFLGIYLNTITMEKSITPERKQSLLQELSALHAHKNA